MATLLERCSIHEAAHAVIGRVIGFECGGAVIKEDGTGSAKVAAVHSLHWDYHARGDIMSSVIDKIVVCFSGGEAERIAFSDANDCGDRRQIEDLRGKYYVDDQDIAAARERARAAFRTAAAEPYGLRRCAPLSL